jgi:preprotein translocase subunit YajC
LKNLQQLLPFLLIPVLFIMMNRGRKKQADLQRQMMSSLADGTEVMTASGVYGFVHSIEGDVIWLEIADGVIIRVSKASVTKIVNKTPEIAAGETPAGGESRPGDDSEKG